MITFKSRPQATTPKKIAFAEGKSDFLGTNFPVL